MERTVKLNYHQKEYLLVCTSRIEFNIAEEYGIEHILDFPTLTGNKRVDVVLDMVTRMNKAAGGPQLNLPDDVCAADFSALTLAAFEAIARGNKRDVEQDDVDEGALELLKKTESRSPSRTSFWRRLLDWVCRKRKPSKRQKE